MQNTTYSTIDAQTELPFAFPNSRTIYIQLQKDVNPIANTATFQVDSQAAIEVNNMDHRKVIISLFYQWIYSFLC